MMTKSPITLLKSNSYNDERYTQTSGVAILTPYLKPVSKILCPFDKEWSAFVSVFEAEGHEVTFSHIDDGKDFFTYTAEEVAEFDYIISNPPFSKKSEILAHLEKLGKPFAMLLGAAGIFESKTRFECLKNLEIELLIPDKRMKFISPYSDIAGNPPFSSWFLCHRILPEKIMFAYLNQ